MTQDQIKLESFWTRRSGVIASVIASIAFTLGLLQDIFLRTEGFSNWSLIVISNMITGAIAGALFYQFAQSERNRRELIRERMKTIAELNHHIRNALQVIKFWGLQHQNCSLDEMQVQLMKESVDRIEWALREILPKYPETAKMLGRTGAKPPTESLESLPDPATYTREEKETKSQ